MKTISAQLAYAAEQLTPVSGELARLEARLLAEHAWGIAPEVIVRDANSEIEDDKIAALESLLARRVQHEPIAQILGRKHFWKDSFIVTRDVLTPRADSETIMEACLKLRPDMAQPYRMLDLGTGSGCLLLSLLREYPNATGMGVDNSAAALNVASANARTAGFESRVEFFNGDWCENLEYSAQFDVVVSNPPYIASADVALLMPDVRDHEPRGALNGGMDGLDCYRAILSQIRPHMKEGALLLFEVGEGQAADVALHAVAHGFVHLGETKDMAGIDRVVALQNINDA